MSQGGLAQKIGGLGWKNTNSNRTRAYWPNPNKLVAHSGSVRASPIGPILFILFYFNFLLIIYKYKVISAFHFAPKKPY